jgi:dihydroorotate dehydrogenase (NAD+) catalytic subunit
MLASGILGISLDVFNRIYRSGAGAVVTKSLSKEPWEGYPNPTIFSVGGGGWINAVGLSNPGAPNFAKMIENNKDVPIIVSLVGSIPEDFEFMINEFANCAVTGYELNLSCPHVAKVGLEVGDDPELVKKIVSTVKKSTKVPVIAKVGLGTTNYLDTVGIAIDSGIDAITAINTVRAMAVDVDTQQPILSNKFGGLSGTPIKPIALRCVYEISSKYDIPIIGCGGISTWEDAVEFFLAGASAIQIGSAVGDRWVDVFNKKKEFQELRRW